MRTEFVQLLASLLLLIFRAEDEHGPKEGKAKRKQVLHDVHLLAAQRKLIPSSQINFTPDTVKAIIAVVETVVALLHAFGVFNRSKEKK